jgi:hypothetical protein
MCFLDPLVLWDVVCTFDSYIVVNNIGELIHQKQIKNSINKGEKRGL